MKNQKIPTWLGTAVIIIIAITVGIFICKIEINNKQFKPKLQKEVIQQNNKKETKAQISTSDWKTCKNEKSNYEFRYPSEWLIVDRYLTVLNDCYNPSNPRGTGFSIGDDRYSASNKSFGINVSTQKDLIDTIHEGVTSLDEYYSEQFLKARTRIRETAIQNERADWFRETNNDKISIWFFHDNTLYEIRTDIDQELLEEVMKTFTFVETEEVSFCGKIYRAEKIIINDVNIIKTIANISEKKNWVCKNMELGNFQKSGIGVAQKNDISNTIALLHIGDAREKNDPFNQSPDIFQFDFKNNKVFYQDQFDGKFKLLGAIK